VLVSKANRSISQGQANEHTIDSADHLLSSGQTAPSVRLGKIVLSRRAEAAVKSAVISRIHPVFVPNRLGGVLETFRGPEHVLHYLARYTHRVAISSHRLLSFCEDQITFLWKDYAHGNKQKRTTLSGDEFLRRSLIHVLPRGFVRIRFFGFVSRRRRAHLLPICRRLVSAPPEGPMRHLLYPDYLPASLRRRDGCGGMGGRLERRFR
jgi:hypothetical protein